MPLHEPDQPADNDHGNLNGLTDDDHTQYALLAGRASGQTLIGGSAASQSLTLTSNTATNKGTGRLTFGASAAADGITFNQSRIHAFTMVPGTGVAFNTVGHTNNAMALANAIDTVTDVTSSWTSINNLFDLDGSTSSLATINATAVNTVEVTLATSPEDHTVSGVAEFSFAVQAFAQNITGVKLERFISGAYATAFDDTDVQNSQYFWKSAGNSALYQRDCTTAIVTKFKVTITITTGSAVTINNLVYMAAGQPDWKRILLYRDGSNYHYGNLNFRKGSSTAIGTDDTQDLTIKTNGATRATFGSGGAITLGTFTGVIRGDSGVLSVDSDVTDIVSAASDSAAGKVELATTAETSTGTDATRAVTPDGLSQSVYGEKAIAIQVFDGATALTTGDGKAYFRIPSTLNGMDLVGAAAGVNTTSSSGTPTFQIARGRQSSATSAHSYVDMLSTRITIDASEYDSKDAATAAVINTSNDDIATGDLIRVDVDVTGTGTAGLNVNLIFRTP